MSSLSYRVLNLNLRLLSGNRILLDRSIWKCSSACVRFGSVRLQPISTQQSTLCQSESSGRKSLKSKESFASLFRNSPLVQLGPPDGKVVQGEVVQVVGDDLYIDFGFKFNAVCRRPKLNGKSYVTGAKVKVRILDLELSDRFLGSPQDMTLLEADVILLGLISSPLKVTSKTTDEDYGEHVTSGTSKTTFITRKSNKTDSDSTL